jgi:CyaY protein
VSHFFQTAAFNAASDGTSGGQSSQPPKKLALSETEFCQRLQELFERVQVAIEQAGIDPDLLEAEQSLGSLTLRFADGSRCILSAQPSVRQLWMAVASKGVAFHFDFDPGTGLWKDDKGQGVEPLAFLSKLVLEATGLSLNWPESL